MRQRQYIDRYNFWGIFCANSQTISVLGKKFERNIGRLSRNKFNNANCLIIEASWQKTNNQ